MINVEELLKPVSSDSPCGEDFTYHPSFQNLESLARGKPETQFSAAEEPDWKEVREAALEVLKQSKHLAAAVIATQALVKTGGPEGLRDGLTLVRGLTEMYWADAYPRLDPEDNNDPTERLNILNQLSSSGFNLLIKESVICSSVSMGRFNLKQILEAKEKADRSSDAPAGPGPDFAQIQAAFREAGADAARHTLELAEAALSQAEAIESFLDLTLGQGRGVNFDLLKKSLSEIKQVVAPHAGSSSTTEMTEVSTAVATERPRAGSHAISGTIQSRADVLRALDLICDFYRQHEPSSPVPLILKRAHRLVDKDFVSILSDLTPDAIQQLQIITGSKTDK